MKRILFERLEKRFSTQTVFPVNGIPGLVDLEKWIGQSIQNRATLTYQGIPSLPYETATAYKPFPSSWSPAGLFPHTYQSSWNYPGASQSYQWSWQTYPWYSANLPYTGSWQTFRPFTYLQGGFWGSQPGYTVPSTTDTPYPPGTRYGLIKRAHLTTIPSHEAV